MADVVTVLVVEDEFLVAEVLKEDLMEAGYSVILASDGPTALSALAEPNSSIDAVVTDIRLPGELSGWDIARKAREVNPAMPVVYASGDSASQWAVQGVPESIMLPKPFASAQLVTAVSQLLNARSALV